MSEHTSGHAESLLRSRRLRSSDLSALVVEFRYFLDACGLFTRITVTKPGEPECSLRCVCHVADPALSVAAVEEAVERIWHSAPLDMAARTKRTSSSDRKVG